MKNVALVCAPWTSIEMPSIALGTLKSVLVSKNISTDVHSLNVKLLKYMDKDLYEEISGSSTHVSEWIFSQYLYNKDYLQGLKINYKSSIDSTVDVDHHLYMYLKKKTSVLQQVVCEKIPNFLDECLNTIDWGSYKIIGFTCALGNQLASLVLSKRIKQRFPNVKIVFGGPNVRGITAEEIMKNFTWVDYIVDGEGEIAFPSLVNRILEGRFEEEIPGVLFRKDGVCVRSEGDFEIVPLDDIPQPDYTEFFDEIKKSGLEEVMSEVRIAFESSRGCWWGQKCQCSFCGLNNGYLKYRTKSQEKVLRELTDQSARYNRKRFFATDLVISAESFDVLLPEMINRKLGYNIFYEVKATMSRKEMSLLAQAGITFVQAGIESLDTKLLKLLRKGVSAIQNIQFLKFSSEFGIYVAWNLLYRMPWEEKESYDKMIELVPLLYHLQPPSAGMIIPIALDRFSPYFNDPQKYGIVDIKPKATFSLIYPDPKINLMNIAYTFDFAFENSESLVMSYIGELITAFYGWQKTYEEKKYYLNYRLVDGKVLIEDNRPLDNNNTEARKYYLENLEKEVFLLCDEISSLQEIQKKIDEGTGRVEADELKSAIGKLMEKKILYEESGRYVNLAVYQN